MSDTTPRWQPDPTGRHQQRYWDGTRWTDHVADGSTTATDTYASSQETQAGEPKPARRAKRPGRRVIAAAIAVVAAVVVLAITRGGGSSEADEISDRIARELERGGMPGDQARCVGGYLVDALGTEDLAQIDFASPRMPDGLSPGFEQAFTETQTEAIIDCEVDMSQLGGS